MGEQAQFTPEERIAPFPGNNGPDAMRGSESDHELSDRSDDLSSRESFAEQDVSDMSDKMALNDSSNIKSPVKINSNCVISLCSKPIRKCYYITKTPSIA